MSAERPVAEPPMPDAPSDDVAVTVVVSGPGHHDRAEAAADLIGHLARFGRVGVQAELRPRLAADVEALIDAGAGAVRLVGSRIAGVFRDRSDDAVGTHDVAGTGTDEAAGTDDAAAADEADRTDALAGVAILVELVASPQPIAASVVADPMAGPSPRADAVAQAVAAWNRAREEADPAG